MFYYDSTFILVLIGMGITIWAQMRVTAAYKKASRIKSSIGLTGFEVARKILDDQGLNDIYIVKTGGNMTDHYDPKRKTVRLSEGVFDKDSIAAISIAAHEVGHAVQDKENYSYLKMRHAILPLANIGSKWGYIAVIIGLFSSITGFLWTGITMLLFAILFQVVTLPVEFNASKRAKENLTRLGFVTGSEDARVKNMLNAAALTYVAALTASLLQVIRLVLIARD